MLPGFCTPAGYVVVLFIAKYNMLFLLLNTEYITEERISTGYVLPSLCNPLVDNNELGRRGCRQTYRVGSEVKDEGGTEEPTTVNIIILVCRIYYEHGHLEVVVKLSLSFGELQK